jgi:phosphoribosylformimino-5-aminoimidazole carboxamide ribotide isomerase
MKIIPAIDIINGNCVRLVNGQFDMVTIYRNSPIDQAKYFEEKGAKYLHIVDLSGAKNGKTHLLKLLEAICKSTNLVVDFGGGIRSAEDIQCILDTGCKQVNLGTFLIQNIGETEVLIQRFGSNKLIASLDVDNEMIRINGWVENTQFLLFDMLHSLTNKGFTNFAITDISRDGTLTSPALELYRKIIKEFPSISLRASGGVSSEIDLNNLKQMGCEGAILGKALYEGVISLETLFKTGKYE